MFYWALTRNRLGALIQLQRVDSGSTRNRLEHLNWWMMVARRKAGSSRCKMAAGNKHGTSCIPVQVLNCRRVLFKRQGTIQDANQDASRAERTHKKEAKKKTNTYKHIVLYTHAANKANLKATLNATLSIARLKWHISC